MNSAKQSEPGGPSCGNSIWQNERVRRLILYASRACLAVRLNGRLDFFGGAVNIAARVQSLSNGNDVLVTDAVLADIKAEALMGAPGTAIAESFGAVLRGIPTAGSVHRLI